MKIGFCAKIDRIGEAARAGFDYLEPPVSAAAAWTEEEFGKQLDLVKNASIPTPAFNVLFPKEMRLLSEETDDKQIADYLHHALARVQKLGGGTVVFGSGKSRTRPEGMPYDAAWRRLVSVTRLIGDVAARYGVTIVIEPLNRTETNMVNSVAEGACLAATVDHPHVKLLADYYHIAAENQPPEDLERLGGIAHAHIAALEGRKAPLIPDEGFRRMFAAMKRTDYRGLVSVEGKADDLLSQGPVCVAMLKKLWEEA